MSQFRTIGRGDTQAIAEVIEGTYHYLEGVDLKSEGLVAPYTHTPEVIGLSGVCGELSDAATRAAHDLGITASREYHLGHYVTSFGALDRLPSEDDPILCLTWGQFNPSQFLSEPQEFFGRRRDIARLVEQEYRDSFSSRSVVYRQVTYTTPTPPWPGHRWLRTAAEDVATGIYPVGQVSRESFPRHQWD